MPVTVWWILPIRTSWETFPDRLAIWSVLTVIVVPIILGTVGGRIYDALFDLATDRSKGWRKGLDDIVGAQVPPTAWDLTFLHEVAPTSGFVVIGFEDGQVLAGGFSSGSEAITSPQTQGIYLEKEWVLDGDEIPIDEVAKTAGLLIPSLVNVR